MAAVSARIAEIQARLAVASSPPRTTTTVPQANPSGAVAAPSFSAALASAVSATTGATAALPAATTPLTSLAATSLRTAPAAHRTPVAVHSTGTLTPAGAPSELAQYGNGEIPPSALERLGDGSQRLWAPAAQAYQRLHAAAQRAGVHIGVTDSYRSYDAQVDLARRKGLHSQGGLAAKPGTSDHGWGKSLDLRLDATAQHWMRAHAGEFGFSENVSREPWHWTYRAAG